MYKRNSKILAALLTIVLVFSIFPSLRINAAVVASGNCGAQGDNVTWTLDDAGVLTISGTGDMADFNYAPWYAYRYSIGSVTIADGITSIGDWAFFDCDSLTSITIPDSVTVIGDRSFASCSNLSSINLPNDLTLIDECAFYECSSLTSIVFPSNLTTIGEHAFSNCYGLTEIDIPDSVTTLGYQAFAQCTSLKSATLSNQLTELTGTFSGCSQLTTVTIPDSVTTLDRTFYYCTSLESITIPDSVTTIGDNAFVYCTNLTNITIPDSVTSIGDWAFSYCTSLTGITIPDSITTIGSSAFNNCTNLTSITIPDSVTSIGVMAFYDCTNLTSITIPDSVTYIGDGAFDSCTSLTSVTIPDSVQDIGDGAFAECTSLTDVAMSKLLYDDLEQYGDLEWVFYGITLPSFHFYYTVDYKSNGNGTITGTTKSFGTDQIELTIQPDSNYELDKIEWSDGTNSGVLTETSGKYTMPDSEAGAVTLTATFKLDQKTVTFKNEDGTVLQTGLVDCGTNPAYTGATPAKAEDDKYTYTFAGWSDGTKTYGPTDTLPAVTDDATYTAVFDSTIKQYTIKFIDEDGSVLQSGNFDYGTTPAYTGSTPTKAEDDDYTYTFAGWTPAITTVTADATYTATFTKTVKPTPQTTPATTPATVSKPGTYYLSSMVEKDGNIVITIKMSEDDTKTFDLLGTVTSDGVALTEGNQYTAAKGSAIITINKSFLDTLAAGNHKLTVTFTDGGSITIDYEVKAPAAAPQVAAQAVQATGEAVSAATIAGACLILTAAGIVITATRKRKEEA